MRGVSHFSRKDWLEYAVTALVLVISVLSLWVAVGTEDANRRMVAAASWPFLEADEGNADEQGLPHLRFTVANSGVGPAKAVVVVPTPSIVGALKLTSSTYTPGAKYSGTVILLGVMAAAVHGRSARNSNGNGEAHGCLQAR